MYRKKAIHFILIVLLFSAACCRNSSKPVILVSKEYGNAFMNWLARVDNNIERISMYTVGKDSIEFYLNQADGIIISGGPDINPAIYGKESELSRCDTIDYRRDTLEIRMITYAMENKIPLLCICRGHQLLNASQGGSLIINIPTDFDTLILHRTEGKHEVNIVENTFLSNIIGKEKGLINSRHHQGVDKIAPGFRASAYAPDGLIEAIEPENPDFHQFILGLQWHPETMIRESDSPFTLPIAIAFMDAVHSSMH